jgi:mono/diheme cytochrome c family protein
MRLGTSAIAIGLVCLSPLAIALSPRTLPQPRPEPQSAQAVQPAPAAARAPVDYARQIAPIFEQHCYECHGANKGRGQLRLHDRTLALAGGVTGIVIVPGHAADSLLVQRIRGEGDDDQMPLKKAALLPEQIALIEAWIDQGALWPDAAGSTGTPVSTATAPGPPKHWAYVKPRRPELPSISRAEWVKNPIDRFILARLDHEHLAPSHEAPRTTLLRRVTLDLIGLPPTLEDLDAFLADTRPDAYERAVDRLLASPRFGERWARPWLDLARYADSNGYEKDNRRSAWAFRDWVIDAFNADMPFDRFTIEQIAGDMLPDATTAQKIASGFHRNAMTNEEGGVDPDESLYEVLVDRVNTTTTVWLGSTVGCAQCHNHKYDPFSQKDYYRLMAFFQNTDYASKTFGDGTRYFEGQLDLASPEQAARRTALEKEIATLEATINAKTPALAAAQARWEQNLRQASLAWTRLKPESVEATNGVELSIAADDEIVAAGANPALTTYTITATTPQTNITGLRLEALPDPSLPKGGPGRDPYGHFRITAISADIAPAVATSTAPSQPQSVLFTSVKVDDAIEKIDPNAFLGRALLGRPITPDATTRTRQSAPPAPEAGMPPRKGASWTIDALKDETRVPRQAVLTADKPFGFIGGTRITVRVAHLDGTLGQGLGRFRLSITSTRAPEQVAGIPARLRPLLALPVARRSDKQAQALAEQFRRVTPLLERPRADLTSSRKALQAFDQQKAMVMKEKPTFERPSAYLRERGAFTAKGPLLYAAVPASLHPMPESQPMNRLGLARWLVDENNPLTARVAVNRLWEQLFGRGLVETSEDFGTQGTPPSHPELLDWLATEFISQKWSQKAMLRLMVTSASYRQDSRVTPALLEHDPYNRLLARGPRFRLEAEMLRDTALSSAGLLSAKLHGPSVFPPQPDGVWNNPFSPDVKWPASEGEDRYRRGLYTFIRRTSPYPTMMALDATSREYCTVRRVRTNTPLQALALMNDEAYFEAAQAMGRRMMDEARDKAMANGLTYGMRLVVARQPDARELARLESLWQTESRCYASHPQEAHRLIAPARSTQPASTQSGSAQPGSAQSAELAAWTVVANVLLNLDEAQTKE